MQENDLGKALGSSGKVNSDGTDRWTPALFGYMATERGEIQLIVNVTTPAAGNGWEKTRGRRAISALRNGADAGVHWVLLWGMVYAGGDDGRFDFVAVASAGKGRESRHVWHDGCGVHFRRSRRSSCIPPLHFSRGIPHPFDFASFGSASCGSDLLVMTLQPRHVRFIGQQNFSKYPQQIRGEFGLGTNLFQHRPGHFIGESPRARNGTISRNMPAIPQP